jgi:hypothetical protein
VSGICLHYYYHIVMMISHQLVGTVNLYYYYFYDSRVCAIPHCDFVICMRSLGLADD